MPPPRHGEGVNVTRRGDCCGVLCEIRFTFVNVPFPVVGGSLSKVPGFERLWSSTQLLAQLRSSRAMPQLPSIVLSCRAGTT